MNNPYNYFFHVLSLIIMTLRSILLSILIVFYLLSCTNQDRIRENPVQETIFDLPPRQELPVLRILDYKNRDEGAVLAPWLRSYLENGIIESELLALYQGSYLFIASIRSLRQPVINQWTANYSLDRDFSRLVAARIQKRLENGLSERPPDMVYGPNYESSLKAAYRNSFWGAIKLDESWILAVPAVIEEDTVPEIPHYWGFILVSIPRETLEIQVVELLSRVSKEGSSAAKEQNAAFDYVKERFFDQF